MLLRVRAEAPELARPGVGAALDLERDFAFPEHEVAFQARLGTPEAHRKIALAVASAGKQLHEHEVFQRAAEVGTGGPSDPAPGQVTGDADVEQIELRRPVDDRARPAAAERLQEDAEQGIDENLKVFPHGLGIDAAVAGHAAEVEQLPVTERQRVEEPRERRHVARQPFVEHFLLEVIVDVAGERAAVLRRVVVLRDQAAIERAQQVERRNLRPRQGMQPEAPGAAAEQVGAPALQLAGAGAAQHEAQAGVFDQTMHLVEQGRHFLHLVDDDRFGPDRGGERAHAVGEAPRRPRELQQQPGVEQVEAGGTREQPPQQGRLAGLARPPQERRLAARQRQVEGAAVWRQFVTHSEQV